MRRGKIERSTYVQKYTEKWENNRKIRHNMPKTQGELSTTIAVGGEYIFAKQRHGQNAYSTLGHT